MIKNKSNLAIKLFIAVWIVLALHITLKLTFNYWQPYVIPNDTLQVISDYIDNNKWLKIVMDLIFYVFNGYIMICCGLQVWYIKNIKLNILTILLLILGNLIVVFVENTIITLLLAIVYPLIINRRKWLYILITFALTNVFLFFSLWLEGFINANDMNHLISTFLVFDYYIMLVLNYFVFNLIKKEGK